MGNDRSSNFNNDDVQVVIKRLKIAVVADGRRNGASGAYNAV